MSQPVTDESTRRCKYVHCNKPLPKTHNGKPLPLTFRYCPDTNHRTLQWEYLQTVVNNEDARSEILSGH